MKHHILCLGDSNTHGMCADSANCADGGVRFNESERWTCLLQSALGEEFLVLEEGLNGRTTVFEDPACEGRSALPYLTPCLMSHAPVALLVIMLGTNDCKARFAADPFTVSLAMRRLIWKAQATACWGPQGPNILVVAPPPLGQGLYTVPAAETMGPGAVERSQGLAAQYRRICAETGAHFADAAGCSLNSVDFIHLDRAGHAQLARRLAQQIPPLLTPSSRL